MNVLAVAVVAVIGAVGLVGATSAHAADPFFGIVAQEQPSDDDFAAMAEGGAGAYRWLVSWPALQPDAGSPPDWSATDRTVASLAEHGIDGMPMVHGSPCWVVQCRKPGPPEAHSQPPLGSPRARAAWASFLGSLVDRYGPGGSFWSQNPSLRERPIATWQIWNEQNAPQFYRPQPSVEGYAELLRISADAIRSRDPAATIVLGGMFGHPSAPGSMFATEFLERLYAIPGASETFDAVAVHPYSPDIAGVERQVVQVREVLNAHGEAATPILITEIGWGTSPSGEGRLVETLDGQAARLAETLDALGSRRRSLNVAAVMWFSWRDTAARQAVCEWCHSSGLIDADGGAKPAWDAYAAASGGTPATPVVEADEGRPPLVAIAVGAAVLVAIGAWLLRRRMRPSGDPAR